METRESTAPERCGAPVPGGTCTATATVPSPATVALPRRTPYDRHAWEDAVLASDLHCWVRLVALALTHHAGPGGYLPDGGPQHTGRMSERTGLRPERVRASLRDLEKQGFLWRPGRDPLNVGRVRPITLTMPAVRARGELPSTGEVPQ